MAYIPHTSAFSDLHFIGKQILDHPKMHEEDNVTHRNHLTKALQMLASANLAHQIASPRSAYSDLLTAANMIKASVTHLSNKDPEYAQKKAPNHLFTIQDAVSDYRDKFVGNPKSEE